MSIIYKYNIQVMYISVDSQNLELKWYFRLILFINSGDIASV